MKKYLKMKLIIAVLLTSGFAAQNSSAIKISEVDSDDVERDVSKVSEISNCSVVDAQEESEGYSSTQFAVYTELLMIYQNKQGEEKYVKVQFKASEFYQNYLSSGKNPNFSYQKVEKTALGYCERFKNSMKFFLPKSNAAETSPGASTGSDANTLNISVK